MKKLIALALALCMTLSMVCMSGAVSFSDDAQIDQKNTEAVTVLSEMGIIGGMGDGTFAPNGSLTRAQAAKIICCLLLGTDKANALSATGAKFSDVPASHWAAKFVNYCADQGIVSGIGNGKFGPNNKLTGFAFAKMLLVAAAGFNAEAEGLVGADWDKNVSKLLKENNLNLGVTVNAKEMPRQNACRLALNCIFYGEEDDPQSTLAYSVFGITRMEGKRDKMNFSRPVYTYSTEEDSICWDGTDLDVTCSPILVGTGKISGGKIVAALNGAEPTIDQITVYRNGLLFNPATFANVLTAGNTTEFSCSGDGNTTEVYTVFDGTQTVYSFTTIANHAAKILEVTEPVIASDGTILEHGSVTLDNGLSGECDAFTTDDIGTYAIHRGYSKMSWKTLAGLISAKKANTITGTLTGYDKGNSVSINNKSYECAYFTEVSGEAYVAAGGAIGDTVTVALDENNVAFAVYEP